MSLATIDTTITLEQLFQGLKSFAGANNNQIIFPVPTTPTPPSPLGSLPSQVIALFELFQPLLGTSTLSIPASNLTSTASNITFSGSVTLWSTSITVNGEFTLVSGNIELTLTLSLPTSWTLATAYSALAGDMMGVLSFTAASYIFSSCANTTSGYQTGLNFSGTLDTDPSSSSPLNDIGTLTGSSSLAVTGTIKPDPNNAGYPIISLQSSTTNLITLTVNNVWPIPSPPMEIPTLKITNSQLQLSGSYQDGDGGYLTSALFGSVPGTTGGNAAQLTCPTPQFSFGEASITVPALLQVKASPNATVNFSQLASLTGGNVVTNEIFKIINAANASLTLTDIGFTVDESAKSIASFSFSLEADVTIIPNLLAIQNATMTLQIDEPFSTTLGRSSFVTFSAPFKFGSQFTVDLSGNYPSESGLFALYGTIPASSTGSLHQLIEDMSTNSPVLKPFVSALQDIADLPITLTGFTIYPENLELQLYISMAPNSGSWPIINEDGFDVKLDEVAISLNITPRQSSVLSGSIGGIFGIGTAPNQLNFSIAVTLPTSDFAFSGELSVPPGSKPQTFQEIIDVLTGYFGTTLTLPSMLQDITLDEMSVTYQAKQFIFQCSLSLNSNVKFELAVNVMSQLNPITKTSSLAMTLEGSMIFYLSNNQAFELDLIFVSYTDTATPPMKHNDFIALTQNPSSQNINLGDLIQLIDSSAPSLPDFSVDLQDLVFVHLSPTPPTQTKAGYIFALNMGAGVNLSALGNLPVVGKTLSSLQTLKLSFQIMYLSQSMDYNNLEKLNQYLTNTGLLLPLPSATTPYPEGVNLATKLVIGNQTINLKVPVNPPTKSSGGTLGPVSTGGGNVTSSSTQYPTQGSDSNSINWIKVQKSFGPLDIERVGFSFDTTTLVTHLDASVSIGTLTLSLLQLLVNVQITGTQSFDVSFGLDGIGVEYDADAVDITAALMKSPSNANEFEGLGIISTDAFDIAAIASFTQMPEGQDAFFIYALLDYPLGGTEFFFITGLAAGFGYNQILNAPPLATMGSFPLVASALQPTPPPLPTETADIGAYLSTQMTDLDQYIVPKVGEYFLSAGIRFTSFEIINSFVLLTVEFGREFEVLVLGLSTVTVPPGLDPVNDPEIVPLAEAQLALKAVFIPSEGVILVQGQLTNNSYVFSKDCHLDGGFATCGWFSGPNTGDFVVTLGGYSSSYNVPSYYPVVPRVGINWQISDNFYIKGGLYFALLPHILMAGSDFEAVWNAGGLQASFDAGGDFLINWKPYHYQGNAFVDIDVSLTIKCFGTHHISFSASANLDLWGPPFGGNAQVQVKIIGIKIYVGIHFGDSPTKPEGISWAEFQSSFLPEAQNIASLTINSGLSHKTTHQLTSSISTDPADTVVFWVADPKNLCLTTNSAIPIQSFNTSLLCSDGKLPTGNNVFGIAPMENPSASIVTEHTVNITYYGGNALPSSTADQFQVTAITRRAPQALWATNNPTDINGASFLPNDIVCGLQITAKPPTPSASPSTIPTSKLIEPTPASAPDPFAWDPLETFNSNDQPSNIWSTIQADIVTSSTRDNIVEALGFDPTSLRYNNPFSEDELAAPLYGQLQSS